MWFVWLVFDQQIYISGAQLLKKEEKKKNLIPSSFCMLGKLIFTVITLITIVQAK